MSNYSRRFRHIVQLLPAQKVVDDGNMLLRRALPQPRRWSIGPYVFADHYKHHGLRGIGDRPHPHAGIEVISYLFEGGMKHRDSGGGSGMLDALEAQYINAGRGMIHAEQPVGGLRHGLQLWTSLPARKKGHHGPMQTHTYNLLAHVRLPAGTDVVIDLRSASPEELGLYVVKGQLSLDDGSKLGPDKIALLSEGDALALHAAEGQEGAECMLLGVTPSGTQSSLMARLSWILRSVSSKLIRTIDPEKWALCADQAKKTGCTSNQLCCGCGTDIFFLTSGKSWFTCR